MEQIGMKFRIFVIFVSLQDVYHRLMHKIFLEWKSSPLYGFYGPLNIDLKSQIYNKYNFVH